MVLPLPDGPTMDTKAPCGTVKDTSRRTVSWCAPLGNSLMRLRASSMDAREGGTRQAGRGTRDAGRGNRRQKYRCWAVSVLVISTACAKKNGDSTTDSSTVSNDSTRVPRPASRVPQVIFVGTSLTAGLGLDPDEAYPALIQKMADSAKVPLAVTNAGLSGETSAGAVRRIDWLMTGPADVVIIETGANDGLRGLDVDATRANIEQLVQKVKQAKPAAKIGLIQMEAPPNLGSRYTAAFHAMFPAIAQKEGVTLLPFLLDSVAGNPKLNQQDGIHPNVVGERIVARTVWRAVQPLLRHE